MGMDYNRELRKLQEIVADVYNLEYDRDKGEDVSQGFRRAALLLAIKFEKLDGSITETGKLPDAWSKPTE